MLIVQIIRLLILQLAAQCAAFPIIFAVDIQYMLANTLVFVFILEFDNVICSKLNGQNTTIKVLKDFETNPIFNLLF